MYNYNEKHLFQLIQLNEISEIYNNLPAKKQLLVNKIIRQIDMLYNILFRAIRRVLTIYKTKKDIFLSEISNEIKGIIFNLKEYNNVKEDDIHIIMQNYIENLSYKKFKELVTKFYIDRDRKQILEQP